MNRSWGKAVALGGALAALGLVSACGDTNAPGPTSTATADTTTASPTASDTFPSNGVATPSPTDMTTPGAAGSLAMDFVISTIEQQYSAQAGGASATVTCSRSGSFPAVAGDSFSCNFSDSRERSGTMTVTVGSANGDFSWSIP